MGPVDGQGGLADPARTTGWERDGVPYDTAPGTTVLMCIAGDGETTGSVFGQPA